MHDAELHCHTLYSKGSVQPIECQTSVFELLSIAKKRGLHMIAITDHNTMAGYFAAKSLAKQMGIILVPAEEIDVKEGGHILAYGIHKEIRSNQPARRVVEQIHDQGGIAIIAHPYDILHPMNALDDIIDDVDGIDFFWMGIINKRKAQSTLKARMSNKLFTIGSDAHTKRLIGAFRMVFSDACNTASDYMRAMREHKCIMQIAIPYGEALFLGLLHIVHMALVNLIYRFSPPPL